MKKIIALTILLAVFTSCSNSDTYQDIETPPEVVTPPGPVTTPEPVVATTYTKNAKSIIDANCVGCHQNGRSAGFRPLTTYAEVKTAVENASLLNRIQLQTGQQGIMPQAGRMSQANIDIIVKWNTDGLKEN
ncbi:cytochrome c [Flavobacterium sp. LS1R49]|uniref:Cytochrome c n=1 Tax=Flavobacterium shii TaxID=2987687 RepID=A0A9X2YUH3_9FLAO|nr:cytochrome c [Flavobacterium shii]MCV9927588.1 cytochrome c [Flavobacterium shii]